MTEEEWRPAGATHVCPACGYDHLWEDPAAYGTGSLEICPCCLFQPGFDNNAAASGGVTSPAEYRADWIAEGSAWKSDLIPPPDSWDPIAQVSRVIASAVAWPRDWQQPAIDAIEPHLGSEDRVRILVGPPETSVSGTAYEGHIYAADEQVLIVHDRTLRADVFPWKLPPGPVLRLELLRPRRSRLLLYAVEGWQEP